MATYKISQETAKRTIGMLKMHADDYAVAAHDVHIGLVSLGGFYTDRASERVYELLSRLAEMQRKGRTEQLASWRASLTQIAEGKLL